MSAGGGIGGFLAGSSYNGEHAANGLTAIFIATGQDVANISESHAGITYARLRDNGDYYWSVTLTSLIVATYGGTGLPTQRECLELLGCYGKRQGAQAGGDLRRDRARRRHLPDIRDPRRPLGFKPRATGTQPIV
jgi:hydroxymethylglutaryl-CoA reductase